MFLWYNTRYIIFRFPIVSEIEFYESAKKIHYGFKYFLIVLLVISDHVGDITGDSGDDTVTIIAISVSGFLFLVSILCTATFLIKRRKKRNKKECHSTGKLQNWIRLKKLTINIILQHSRPTSIFLQNLKILGNESEDEDDGYDAAYGDVGVGALPPSERPSGPNTFETVTMVDNVYYEASNEI